MPIGGLKNSFNNEFDLSTYNISELTIKENSGKDNCFIYHTDMIIGSFIVSKNSRTKILIEVTFYKSNKENKYIPRLKFRKVDLAGNTIQSKGTDVIIDLADGDTARRFWTVVNFLQGFKELIDLGEFKSNYQAVSFDSYLLEFKNKEHAKKVQEISSLVDNSKLSNDEIKKLLFSQRRKCIHWFYALLKNLNNAKAVNVFDSYRKNHFINAEGEEAIWHHFLKNNDWIIGLNVDVRFIRDLLSEQKVGFENSLGRQSPKVDFLGISYFTTLIEIKTSKSKIFKENKSSNSRSNTWDFSSEFIEAYSQALSQRTELSAEKKIVHDNNTIIDSEVFRTLDPKAVLIIGNRNEEFPHTRNSDLNVKSDCFERLRRDNRNVEIVTYDELFERAFHIVYHDKLPIDWYKMGSEEFISDVLKVVAKP